jgi:hypothetical protein
MRESTFESLNKHVGIVIFSPFADLDECVLLVHHMEVLLNGDMSKLS